jgi:pilus assembly protein CpaB
MRAKTVLTVLFIASVGVAVIVVLRALPHNVDAAIEAAGSEEILAATTPLTPGTLLRAHDIAWQAIAGAPQRGDTVRPSAAAREAKPEIDEETRAAVYGAALRTAIAAGDPIRRSTIVKPGDRDFLQIVLSPGARAIAIPVTTGGASTGLLFPGDRVDVILTQKFADTGAPLTRRSVSETVVENLRVLVIDALDAKMAAGNTFGRTVTLEVMPDQAEKINVAAELGKLSLTLRSVSGADGVATASTTGPGKATGIKPTWAGDVSPALGGAMPPDRVLAAERPPVEIIRGSGKVETRKTE